MSIIYLLSRTHFSLKHKFQSECISPTNLPSSTANYQIVNYIWYVVLVPTNEWIVMANCHCIYYFQLWLHIMKHFYNHSLLVVKHFTWQNIIVHLKKQVGRNFQRHIPLQVHFTHQWTPHMEANLRSHPDEQQDQLRSPIRTLRACHSLYKARICVYLSLYIFFFSKMYEYAQNWKITFVSTAKLLRR